MSVIFIRTILLYALMTAAVRLMGKRQVGELQPLELVVTIIMSNIASLPLEHASMPLFTGLIPVLTLVSLEVVVSALSLRFRPLRRLVEGSPVTVIYDGRLRQQELRALRFSIDDLMEELRIAGVFDITDVQAAVVETSGKLSIRKRPGAEPLTPGSLATLGVTVGGARTELALSVPGEAPPPETGAFDPPHSPPPPFVAVSDGSVNRDALELNGVAAMIVYAILENEGVPLRDTLLLTLDTKHRYHLVKRELGGKE